jgi:hypothetical protein
MAAKPSKIIRWIAASVAIVILPPGCIARSHSDAEGARILATPEFQRFLADYREAVNSRNVKKMLAQCVYPTCRRKAKHGGFENEFEDPIPADVTVVVTAIAPDAKLPALLGSSMHFKQRPAIQVDLRYSGGKTIVTGTSAEVKSYSRTTSLFCAMYNGRWYEVY